MRKVKIIEPQKEEVRETLHSSFVKVASSAVPRSVAPSARHPAAPNVLSSGWLAVSALAKRPRDTIRRARQGWRARRREERHVLASPGSRIGLPL